jgi:hypothetical protein
MISFDASTLLWEGFFFLNVVLHKPIIIIIFYFHPHNIYKYININVKKKTDLGMEGRTKRQKTPLHQEGDTEPFKNIYTARHCHIYIVNLHIP